MEEPINSTHRPPLGKYPLMDESKNQDQLEFQVELSPRDLKLIQNYLQRGRPLNDPANSECMELVARLLGDVVAQSGISEFDQAIANWLRKNLGVQMDVDPYGRNTGIPLESGLAELADAELPEFRKDGRFSRMVVDGFWADDGHLGHGWMDLDGLNQVLAHLDPPWGVRLQLREDGPDLARVLVDI